MSTHAQVLRLRRVRRCLAVNGSDDVAFSLSGQDRHTKVVPVFKHKTGSSMAGLRYPSHGRSRQTGYPIRPSAEGRSSWLNFLRKILSFSIPNRFIPAHPDTFDSIYLGQLRKCPRKTIAKPNHARLAPRYPHHARRCEIRDTRFLTNKNGVSDPHRTRNKTTV